MEWLLLRGHLGQGSLTIAKAPRLQDQLQQKCRGRGTADPSPPPPPLPPPGPPLYSTSSISHSAEPSPALQDGHHTSHHLLCMPVSCLVNELLEEGGTKPWAFLSLALWVRVASIGWVWLSLSPCVWGPLVMSAPVVCGPGISLSSPVPIGLHCLVCGIVSMNETDPAPASWAQTTPPP